MNRKDLLEWCKEFEKSNSLFILDVTPDLKLLAFKKSLLTTRSVGVFEDIDDFMRYLEEHKSC